MAYKKFDEKLISVLLIPNSLKLLIATKNEISLNAIMYHSLKKLTTIISTETNGLIQTVIN